MIDVTPALADELLGEDEAPWDAEPEVLDDDASLTPPTSPRGTLLPFELGNKAHGEAGRFATDDSGISGKLYTKEPVDATFGLAFNPKEGPAAAAALHAIMTQKIGPGDPMVREGKLAKGAFSFASKAKAYVATQVGTALAALHSEKELIKVREELLKASDMDSTDPMLAHLDGLPPGAAVAALMVRTWAETSSDGHAISREIQTIAQEEFGLKTAEPLPAFDGPSSESRALKNAPSEALRGVVRSYVRETYRQTQAQLKEAGITEVTLYRGGSFYEETGEAPTSGVTHIRTRPLTSFSTSFKVAGDFAVQNDDDDSEEDSEATSTAAMMMIRVPASRIFATPGSGPGCAEEEEMLVLGGRYRAFVAYDYDDSTFRQKSQFHVAAAKAVKARQARLAKS